jgi:hypothetical protein
MSQLVKTKRQTNFKGFKRFGAFKGLVEQKNLVFNSFVCKLGLFWPTRAKKDPIYTQTRQINYYLIYQALLRVKINKRILDTPVYEIFKLKLINYYKPEL